MGRKGGREGEGSAREADRAGKRRGGVAPGVLALRPCGLVSDPVVRFVHAANRVVFDVRASSGLPASLTSGLTTSTRSGTSERGSRPTRSQAHRTRRASCWRRCASPNRFP